MGCGSLLQRGRQRITICRLCRGDRVSARPHRSRGALPLLSQERGFIGGARVTTWSSSKGWTVRRRAHRFFHRLWGRRAVRPPGCQRRFAKAKMEAQLQRCGVLHFGADLDESPLAYRLWPDVLAHDTAAVNVCTRCAPSRWRWRATAGSIRGRIDVGPDRRGPAPSAWPPPLRPGPNPRCSPLGRGIRMRYEDARETVPSHGQNSGFIKNHEGWLMREGPILPLPPTRWRPQQRPRRAVPGRIA